MVLLLGEANNGIDRLNAVNKRHFIKFILLGNLFGTIHLVGADKNTCEQANEKLYQEQNKLGELNQLREDLEKRFEEYSKEDFSAQVEGIKSELHRNKAIKVAFAKRRLTKLIDTRVREISSTTENYCKKCEANQGNEATHDRYCENCPDYCTKKK